MALTRHVLRNTGYESYELINKDFIAEPRIWRRDHAMLIAETIITTLDQLPTYRSGPPTIRESSDDSKTTALSCDWTLIDHPYGLLRLASVCEGLNRTRRAWWHRTERIALAVYSGLDAEDLVFRLEAAIPFLEEDVDAHTDVLDNTSTAIDQALPAGWSKWYSVDGRLIRHYRFNRRR